jgi:C-methyltransferase C-terminal domain/Putative zinc binding domain/Methyltransferase domain
MKFICLLCSDISVEKVLCLPESPLANSLPMNNIEVQFYPLDLGICKSCGHIQLTYIVDPEVLFTDYPYLSNSGSQAVNRLNLLADALDSKFSTKKKNFVIEIGSNDGYLLKQFKNKGWSVLGIDPSVKASHIANENHIETISDFFSLELANTISITHSNPDLIIANNVLAHTNKMNEIFSGIEKLMTNSTILVVEFSYVLDVYEKLLIDTIYHEHMSYHALIPLTTFLTKFNLFIFDAIRFDAHGGSLRIYIKKVASTSVASPRVKSLIKKEKKLKLYKAETWAVFEKRLEQIKLDINELLSKLVEDGKLIVGFGVPAKFTTLFYALGLDEKYFWYMVDDNPLKHYKFAPGTNLQIFDSSRLKSDTPNYLFIFSWNYAESIMNRINDNQLSTEGIIVPLPVLSVKKIQTS